MASMTLDLPAPVGPVSANRSTPSKSTTVRSRNAVKPSSSSRTGLIRRRLLDQLGEERQPASRRPRPGCRPGTAGTAPPVRAWPSIQPVLVGPARTDGPPGRCPGRSTWTSTHSGKLSRTCFGQPDPGRLPQPHAQVVVPGRPRLRQHLVQGAVQGAQAAAAAQHAAPPPRPGARDAPRPAAPHFASAVSPKSSCSGEPA